MQEDTSALILTELRELRNDFNDFARQSGERLSKLERDNYLLMGNGQPGRIARLETSVEMLQEWRWWLIGASAGVSTVVSIIAWFLRG